MTTTLYIISVAVGGAAGALCRGFFSQRLNGIFHFPLGTFFVNIVASFLVGTFTTLQVSGWIPSSFHPLIDIGFCATLSTFSTLAWEIAEMIKAKRFFIAIFYISATFIFGITLFAYAEYLFKGIGA